MYSVAVQREFDAQHYLVGGEWGSENFQHTHHYRLELELSGKQLNQQGFLVDIVEIEKQLKVFTEQMSGSVLNDLPEFAGLNPSIEHFCRIACQQIGEKITGDNISQLTVRLWENTIAWASYTMER